MALSALDCAYDQAHAAATWLRDETARASVQLPRDPAHLAAARDHAYATLAALRTVGGEGA